MKLLGQAELTPDRLLRLGHEHSQEKSNGAIDSEASSTDQTMITFQWQLYPI